MEQKFLKMGGFSGLGGDRRISIPKRFSVT
jgi:hypothetical protein